MENAKVVKIQGKQLKCPFCKNTKFFEFNVKMNTFSVTFGSGLWSMFAKKAGAYVCSNCGLKQEFLRK
tara:strand:- start:1635 stop:1838 length:204 start_codon:yes stop_codon:yes gene_type:complete